MCLLLAWPAACLAHAGGPPREAPGLAEVTAGDARFATRVALPGSGDLRFATAGARALPQGASVIVGAGRDGDVRSLGRLHATYVDGAGIAWSGWLDRRALRQVSTRHVPTAWDGHWRSSAGARDLTISQGSVSYSYRSEKTPGARTGLLLKLSEIAPDEARMWRAESAGGTCELDARRLGRYLVIASRDCQTAGANPDAVLRRVR